MNSRKVALVVVASVCVSAAAWAAPVLHEYFDVEGVAPPAKSPATDLGRPDPEARNAAGGRERASGTAGGDSSSDGAGRARAAADKASHDALADVADADRYQLDANTSRPDSVSYSDPFTPALPPFKRMYAYDAVDSELELVVAERALKLLRIGARVAAGDDQFLGDLSVDLVPGQLLRVPSVGPGARVIAFKLEPAQNVTLLADSAENWFVRSNTGGTARLLMHLAIDHEVFGSSFKQVSWDALAAALPTRPGIVFDSAEPVLRRIGVSQDKTPSQALSGLVQYFREFAPSDEELSERGPALYERIALGQKGVCRHRAFAFVVTALALGLPSRFVHNEAHAWVEVFDTSLWHRIDLGGAANHAGLEEPLALQHVAPSDPFPWPPKSERGTDMVSRSASGAGGTSGPGATASAEQSTPAASSEPTSDSPSAEPSIAPDPAALGPAASASVVVPQPSASAVADPAVTPGPGSEPIKGVVKFVLSDKDVTRGARIALNGRVTADGATCSMLRVSIVLHGARQQDVPVGALVTDTQGRFAGEIVVPDTVPVGDYDLRVVAAGSCTNGSATP